MNIITIYTDTKGATLSTANGTMPAEIGQKLYDTDSFREVIDVKKFFSQNKNLSGHRIVLSDPIPIDSPLARDTYLSLHEIRQMIKEVLEEEHKNICALDDETDSDTTVRVKQLHFDTELKCIKNALNRKFGISI